MEMDRQNLKPIQTEHGELIVYRDWDCEGAIYMENARTLDRYFELKNTQPDCDEFGVFFAFSHSQFQEGYNHLIELGKIKDGDKVVSLGAGGYAVESGIEGFLGFYEGQNKKIAAECDAQEIYFYEWNNHECMYSNDDEPFSIVKELFGDEIARKIVRL